MSKKNWTQEDLQQAIAEVRHGKTIKGSARKYGKSETMIRYKMKKVYQVKRKINNPGDRLL